MKLALSSAGEALEVDADDVGEGPALVLIHGGPGLDRRYFRPWFDALSATHRVVSWDLSQTGERSVSAWSRQLFLVMDALSIQTAHVLGHSFGVTVAAAAALDQPSRVRSLVLVSPPGLGSNQSQLAHVLSRGTRQQIAKFLGPVATTQSDFDEHWRTMLPLYFADAGSPHIPGLAAMSVDFEVFKDGVASLEEMNLATKLALIETPALVCGGAHDWLSDAEVVAGWVARMPNASKQVFTRSAHFTFMEEHPLFVSVLRAFLGP